MIKKIFLSLIAVVLLMNVSYGQGTSNLIGQNRLNTITTAVPFLLIAPDSRAAGMGDVGCATSADINSQHHNPSKYVFNTSPFGISVSYVPWLRKLGIGDINLLYLSTYYKITDMDAVAFSLRYFSLGSITFTNDEGFKQGDYHPSEFSMDFTYSRKLIDELSIAITPRFIYSNLTQGQYVGGVESEAGLAGAADISLLYQQDFRTRGMLNSTLRAGLNISNIGNKMSYSKGTLKRDFIPTNLKLGLSYTMEFNQYNKLMLAFDINKLLVPTPPIYEKDSLGNFVYDAAGNKVIAAGKDNNVSVVTGIFRSFADAPGVTTKNPDKVGTKGAVFLEELQEINVGVGLEYSYRDLLFVRMGYFYESPYKGNRQFLTLGAGLKYSIFEVDVSYMFTIDQHHPLENTLRFSLGFDVASFNKKDIKESMRLK